MHSNLYPYVGEQKSDFGLQGGNTVHKGILEFVLYYIRFDLQGGGVCPPCPPLRPRMLVSHFCFLIFFVFCTDAIIITRKRTTTTTTIIIP